MTQAEEYENTTDRLDAMENRLRLAKKTMNEIIAFANGLETRIEALETRREVIDGLLIVLGDRTDELLAAEATRSANAEMDRQERESLLTPGRNGRVKDLLMDDQA
jgi:hypothetical protein